MNTSNIIVHQNFEITLDESKFTPEFIKVFKESFYNLNTFKEHRDNIAKAYSMGFIRYPNYFFEGYGNLEKSFGFKIKTLDTWVEED